MFRSHTWDLSVYCQRLGISQCLVSHTWELSVYCHRLGISQCLGHILGISMVSVTDLRSQCLVLALGSQCLVQT